jgi:hypothetical protein
LFSVFRLPELYQLPGDVATGKMEIDAGGNPLARDFGGRGRRENGLMISKIGQTVAGCRVKAEKCPKRAAMDGTNCPMFPEPEGEGVDVAAPEHFVVQRITRS